MKITIFQKTKSKISPFLAVLVEFFQFFFHFLKKKVISLSIFFEKNKNRLVKLFIVKRGRYNRPFLHLATMIVLFIGILVAPFLAETYPIFASNTSTVLGAQTENQEQSVEVSEDVFTTQESKKPRDKIITYTVQKGDTLSTIAKKFEISTDTIRWENDFSGDNITVGDQLKILPVTGLAYKVESGDTVYSIGKKFDTEPQKVADFPFNDFANPETFSLVVGQMLIIPDGIKPSERQNYGPRQVYIAQGPVNITSAGFTWPLSGGISQFSSWYHTAIDITDSVGTPIVAAQNGKVTSVATSGWNYGYGINIYIQDSNGMGSHYAHLSGVSVSEGQDVIAGKTVIGWVGMTGRTTGPHLHFEVSQNGALIDPMRVLK